MWVRTRMGCETSSYRYMYRNMARTKSNCVSITNRLSKGRYACSGPISNFCLLLIIRAPNDIRELYLIALHLF